MSGMVPEALADGLEGPDDRNAHEIAALYGRPCWNSCCPLLALLWLVWVFLESCVFIYIHAVTDHAMGRGDFMHAIFQSFDLDRDCYLSRDEFARFCNVLSPESDCNTQLDAMDLESFKRRLSGFSTTHLHDLWERAIGREEIPMDEVAPRSAIIAGSLLVGFIITACGLDFCKRQLHVQVSSSLLGQMVLRGATGGIAVAVLVNQTLHGGPVQSRPDNLSAIAMCVFRFFLVGWTEEWAKLVAVSVGLARTLAEVPAAHALGPCGRALRCVVESPQGLALCGMAIGFGFMIRENATYFLGISLGSRDSFILFMLRNNPLHALWSGISACKLAKRYWTNSFLVEPLELKWRDYVSILWYSSMWHAAFNFLVTVLPITILPVEIVSLCWLISKLRAECRTWSLPALARDHEVQLTRSMVDGQQGQGLQDQSLLSMRSAQHSQSHVRGTFWFDSVRSSFPPLSEFFCL